MTIPDQPAGPPDVPVGEQRTVPPRSEERAAERPREQRTAPLQLAPARVDRAYVRAARLREPWWPKLLMYAVLFVMAFGDAFGIYQTLLRLVRGDTVLVQVFTVALTLSAVTGAHEVGRLTRAWREGRDGHPVWIALLVTFWLTVGLGVAWLRITQPLARRDEVAGLPSLQFGLLLLGLYLLTGGLAMTTAYRYGSRHTAELQALVKARRRAAREAAEQQFDAEYAAARAERLTEERRRLQEERGDDLHEAFGAFLKTAASFRQARHEGDPEATDELIPPATRGRGTP